MEYGGFCDNKTCSFFPTEQYTADEIFQIVSSRINSTITSNEEYEPALGSGRNLSVSIMNFLINLPESQGDIKKGLEWMKMISETAHFEQQELHITICPGCNQVKVEQW